MSAPQVQAPVRKVTLPKPTETQQIVLDHHKRFALVVAGEGWGKSTLAVRMLLASKKGALTSRVPVALLAWSTEHVDRLRRTVLSALGDTVRKRVSETRVELVNGGLIDFIPLENGQSLLGEYGLVVVDDAHKIPDFDVFFDDSVKPALAMHVGHMLAVAQAYGKNNGFYRRWEVGQRQYSFWSCHHFTSWVNPHLPEEIHVRAKEVTEPERLQRFEAEFLDVAIELSAEQRILKPGEAFIEWCERLAESGMKVDGHPFRLDDRPAMRFIYEWVPNTVEDAFDRIDVMMKSVQVGFTLAEMLMSIFMALRFAPAKIGMFLPSQPLAGIKSSERFMPIVRTIPDVHRLFGEQATGGKKKRGGKVDEGNVLVRRMGSSLFHFLWTTGKTTTESNPLDIVSFDEVQEMKIADMEKTRERMSASKIRYTFMGSTANWPDQDIHWWYKRGTQHQFHTMCKHCGTAQVLDEHFPACIRFDPDAPRLSKRERDAGMTGEYRYVCHNCEGWIDDPQYGEWVAKNPDATIRSLHFPQFLSPTISPRKIIEGYHNADDMKNFYNRVLGKPYTDPSQVPVDLAMLNECARIGQEMGLAWETRGRGYFMGLDQMGSMIVAFVAKRMQTGHMGIVHYEVIQRAPTPENPDASPWDRADELMHNFAIAVCVVETLPNYDSAKSFARRHHGKVFLAGYGNMDGDMLIWGDKLNPDASENRTNDEFRDRFTVRLDQYKVMQLALKRFATRTTLFPNPDGLVQQFTEKGQTRMVAALKEIAFLHFQRTALVAEKDEEEKKFKRRVVKVGIDPHSSYAYMLLMVAWTRAFGTSEFVLPAAKPEPSEVVSDHLNMVLPGLADAMIQADTQKQMTCGKCMERQENGYCPVVLAMTGEKDPGCVNWLGSESFASSPP